MSDNPGLVDFAIGLVNSIFNLPDGQVMFFEESYYRRTVKSILLVKKFFGLVKVTSGPRGGTAIYGLYGYVPL